MALVEWLPGAATEALQYHLRSISECGQGCHSGVTVSTLAREARGLWFDSQLWQFFPCTLPLPALEPSLMFISEARTIYCQKKLI